MHWENVTVFCFFASYGLALLLEGTQFVRRSRVTRWAALGFTCAGLVAHTAYLVVRSRQVDLPPLLASTHDWLLVLAWLATVFYIGVQVWDRQFSLGIFALPLILLLTGASRLVSTAPNPRIGNVYWWGMLHASLWVLGICGMALALVTSVMYLVQHNRLKHKRSELPALHLLSLERLGRFNWWLVIVSVPLLTCGMISGIWMAFIAGDAEHPVTLISTSFVVNAVIWGMMALLFGWLLISHRPAGKLVAWRTILACSFFLCALLLMKMFGSDDIHGSTHTTATSQISEALPITRRPAGTTNGAE